MAASAIETPAVDHAVGPSARARAWLHGASGALLTRLRAVTVWQWGLVLAVTAYTWYFTWTTASSVTLRSRSMQSASARFSSP